MKVFAVVEPISREVVFCSFNPERAEGFVNDERFNALKEANEAFSYDLDNLTEEELRDLILGAGESRAFNLRVFPLKIEENDETVSVTDDDGEIITLQISAILKKLEEADEH